MSAHGKRYRAAREAIDREEAYTPLTAVRLLKDLEGAKFDETVEAHFRLGLNVRHADQQLRGTIMLPHGIGKDVRADDGFHLNENGAEILALDIAEVVKSDLRTRGAAI